MISILKFLPVKVKFFFHYFQWRYVVRKREKGRDLIVDYGDKDNRQILQIDTKMRIITQTFPVCWRGYYSWQNSHIQNGIKNDRFRWAITFVFLPIPNYFLLKQIPVSFYESIYFQNILHCLDASNDRLRKFIFRFFLRTWFTSSS